MSGRSSLTPPITTTTYSGGSSTCALPASHRTSGLQRQSAWSRSAAARTADGHCRTPSGPVALRHGRGRGQARPLEHLPRHADAALVRAGSLMSGVFAFLLEAGKGVIKPKRILLGKMSASVYAR